MLCFSGFELYSRWVPLKKCEILVYPAFMRTEQKSAPKWHVKKKMCNREVYLKSYNLISSTWFVHTNFVDLPRM